jgi:hypothetical protein
MKKALTFALAMFLGACLSLAQTGGDKSGGTQLNPQPIPPKPPAQKNTSKTSKAHKGGKKSKKGSKTGTTTTPK